MTSDDPWSYCPPCQDGRHDDCDPVEHWCTCWACLPNDYEIPQPREGQ